MLDRKRRHHILKNDWGITQHRLASTLRSINSAKSRRWQTQNNLKYFHIEEKWQGAVNKVKKTLRLVLKCTDRQIDPLWEQEDLSLCSKRAFNSNRHERVRMDSKSTLDTRSTLRSES